jgi:E3 ubiquitin-protein ligase TRIP12
MNEPMTLSLDSVRNNLKKERLLEDRYAEIDRENQHLLKKMADIMKQPSAYTTEASKNLPTSMNKSGRKKDLLEITKENRRMLKAIQGAAPIYSQQKWEKHWQQSHTHLKNCCSYPIVTRMSRNQSAPSRLVPLQPEYSQLNVPGGGSSAAGASGDGPVVFKDGKQIGDSYFLIEMSTDGRTLTVSAYDGESQKSMELIVKEKKHRDLNRECNGDYSLIAARLRVDGDRLVIDGMA